MTPVTPKTLLATAAPPNPLALGQWVQKAQDAGILVAVSGTSSTFQQVTFTSSAGDPPGVAIQASAQSIPMAALGDVVDVAVIDDAQSCRQSLAVLWRDSENGLWLDLLAKREQTADVSRQSRPLTKVVATSVIGVMPTAGGDGPILLGGGGPGGVVLTAISQATGSSTASWTLSASTSLSVLGGQLLRGRAGPLLMLVVASAGALSVLSLSTAALEGGASLSSGAVQELAIGAYSPEGTVSLCAATLSANSAQQEGVVVYTGSDSQPRLVTVRMDDAGKLQSGSSVDLGAAFAAARPESQLLRVASADLNDDGLDELIVAYPATYGEVAGAAAFLLLSNASGSLAVISTYAAASAEAQPLASAGLHIAAGLFGDGVTRGVLVLGAGSSLSDLMQGKVGVLAGFVSINPNSLSFPALSSQPAVLANLTRLATYPANNAAFRGVAADFAGNSVVLGPPTFTTASAATQILAILQAPPYEAALSKTLPSLTFTKMGDDVTGYNVSSNKMWSQSDDVGASIGVSSNTFTHHMSKTYGQHFDKMDDSTTSRSVQITTTIVARDTLLVYAMDYWVWQYPVFKSAQSSKPSGTMLVVFPATPLPIQQLVSPYEDKNYGYSRAYENGRLASYLGLDLDGYDSRDTKSQLFAAVGLAVSDDSGDASATFDQSNMNQETVNKGYNVYNTTSNGAHFALSTTIFDYLPVNFGLNISSSTSYSDSEVSTTTLTHTDQFSVSISAGTVNDGQYAYEVVTHVYQHQKLQCLVVGYEVNLVGVGWNDYLSRPTPMLVRPFRIGTKNTLLSCFSRSVSFVTDESNGAVTIVITILNEGNTKATGVHCQAFLGLPIVQTSGQPGIDPNAVLLGQASGQTIGGLQRLAVRIPFPNAKDRSVVAVKVWGGVVPEMVAEIGWNVYPPERYADMDVASLIAQEAVA